MPRPMTPKTHYLSDETIRVFTDGGQFANVYYEQRLTHQINLHLTEDEYTWAIANRHKIRTFIRSFIHANKKGER